MKINLNKSKLVAMALLPLVLLNTDFGRLAALSVLWDALVLFCFFFYPGLLILKALKIAKLSLTHVLYAVGLSIIYTMLLGLSVNTLLPILGDLHPLTHGTLLLAFDVTMSSLVATILRRQAASRIKLSLPKVNARVLAVGPI